MRISWLGHACFMVEHDGYRVVIDPLCDVPGCRNTSAEAEEVLCSHDHFDHNYRKGVALQLSKDSPFTVETVKTFHDEQRGALRGDNTIHILRAGGMKLVHLGDLGHPLSGAQAESLRGCDVLLIPVGGTYTVDGDTAAEIVKSLQPRVTIPMHYRGDSFGFDNINTLEPFLAHFTPEEVHFADSSSVELTADTPCGVIVLAFPV